MFMNILLLMYMNRYRKKLIFGILSHQRLM